jgi:formylglycine-generating enzyme required for sulfatase activity
METFTLEQGARLLDDPSRVAFSFEAGCLPIQATWEQARAACAHLGYRMCTSREWEDACDGRVGPGGAAYPTLSGAYTAGDCAFTEPRHAPRQPLSLTGAHPACVTPTGVADLSGNLWEWTDPERVDARGLPLVDKRGGAHYGRDPVGCAYQSVGSHEPSFYATTGFRCCARSWSW